MNVRHATTFCLIHSTGTRLYPVQMRNRDTGRSEFRLSKGGNTLADTIAVDDEATALKMVSSGQWAIRASSLDCKTQGLYKVGCRSVPRVERLA